MGPRTEERIRQALDRGGATAARPLLLHRARALSEQLATALGGVAGGRLAPLARGSDPARRRGGHGRARGSTGAIRGAARDRRDARRGRRRDGRRRSGRARRRAARALRDGARARDRLGRVRGVARTAAGRRGRRGCLSRRWVSPYLPPELREVPVAGAPRTIAGGGRDPRGSALPLDVVGRQGDGARDGRGGHGALGYEYLAICDHTSAVDVVQGLDADDVRRQGEEIAAVNEQLAPFRVLRGIECDILPDGEPRPARRRARRARLGADLAARRPARPPEGADGPGHPCHAPPGSALPEPSDGPHRRSPARERARPGADDRGGARNRVRARGERPPEPARPLAARTCARRLPRESRSSARATPTPSPASPTCATRCTSRVAAARRARRS